MPAIDERLTHAVLRLRSPEMQPLVEYITGEADKALGNLALADDTPAMYRNQGAVRALRSLLKHFSDVEKLASK